MLNCSNWEVSNILLNSIMESCQDIITVKDLNFKYLAFNKAFSNVIKKTDLLGKFAKDVLSNETYSVIRDNLRCVVETGKPKTFTIKIKNNNLDIILTQTATPIIKNGKITKILSVSHDVTFEESLKMKLVEKICQLNTLLEHIPLLVYMKDKNCKYITGSKYAKNFVENGVDCYSDNISLDLNFIQEIINHEDLLVMSSNKMRVKELEALTTDGLKQWYRIYKAPICKHNNEVDGIVTIAKNITKEKQLDAQKELFLATLTHDLKNPVQALVLSLKMLNNGTFGNFNKEQKEMFEMIIESANYMQDMLHSILLTYKFDNGIITLQKEKFNPKDLVQTCVNEIKAFADTKNIKLICNFKTDKNLFADKNQLRRVISNLLNNALNYSYKDTELKICVQDNGENVIFSFENSSPEIPKELQKHIFDKYVTGAENYKLTGVGLGLYFSQKVIEAHNGKIYLQSHGTQNRFVFEIPLVDKTKDAVICW